MATTQNLFDVMMRHGIGLGFDPTFFERSADAPNYPPHNIVQLGDDQYLLTLAVAGFAESDIEITLHNDMLTVSGHRKQQETGNKMLYNGIAFRDFSRQFKIGDHVEIDGARLQNGLLMIDLVRRLPESAKPRRIEIGEKPRDVRLAA